MNCIKKFSRIVCVSLFSYQGCFAVISLRQLIYFIISFRSCQALFQKFLRFSRSCLKLFVSVVLFKRLDYFIINSVICQQLIWIFWKLFYFSVFQKQFLATACLLYHCRKESSSTFYKKVYIFLCRLFSSICWCKYFSLVAKPPLICLSDLFTSNTALACLASAGFKLASLVVTSLCTVDFDIPNLFAVCLTVALVSII